MCYNYYLCLLLCHYYILCKSTYIHQLCMFLTQFLHFPKSFPSFIQVLSKSNLPYQCSIDTRIYRACYPLYICIQYIPLNACIFMATRLVKSLAASRLQFIANVQHLNGEGGVKGEAAPKLQARCGTGRMTRDICNRCANLHL